MAPSPAAANTGTSDIFLAAVDFETGQLLRAPVRRVEQSVGFNGSCDLSVDGKKLAYMFAKSDWAFSLGIRSIETGEVRIPPPALSSYAGRRNIGNSCFGLRP